MIVKGASDTIEFYKKVFDAREIMRFLGSDGKSIMRAEIRIGDSSIMLSDEHPQMKYLSRNPLVVQAGIFLYVQNADDVFSEAISAGPSLKCL